MPHVAPHPSPVPRPFRELLRGHRFTVCDDDERAAGGLAVRRRVYVEDGGYAIPVPDAYDTRSWLLVAEDLAAGCVVGTMRITPRGAGRFEAEEYFALPAHLRTPAACEISRFAILPAWRKSKTFLPVVSLGLFKCALLFLGSIGARYAVIASRPERLWTYEWLLFERTGLVARYAKLAGAEHELLWHDMTRVAGAYATHPLGAFFADDSREIVVPERTPPLGIAAGRLRLARTA